jgi:Ser/Thr protein kinase RdoA (MazF antagonist)
MTLTETAVATASQYGIVVTDPVVLSDSNNVVLWLRPAPVVAKVATGHHRRLRLELATAQHVVAKGGPVVPPAEGLPAEVHRVDDLEMTFWGYQRSDNQVPDPRVWARALLELHDAMLSYPGMLPSYEEELLGVAEVLSDDRRTPTLSVPDRRLLLSALDRFRGEVTRCGYEARPLHGSPHSGNTLVSEGLVRFIDFETACRGPLEWDLAHIDDEAVDMYPERFDRRLLEACRALASIKTAAWCWVKFEHPSLQWHARHHLEVVRRLALR